MLKLFHDGLKDKLTEQGEVDSLILIIWTKKKNNNEINIKKKKKERLLFLDILVECIPKEDKPIQIAIYMLESN